MNHALQKVLDASAGKPALVVDGRTQATYVLVRAEVYEQLTRNNPVPTREAPITEIPEGIRRSRAALRNDLPELLAKRRDCGKWVCYHREERIGIGNEYAALIRECARRGLTAAEFIIERIAPGAGSEEEEEIDRTFVEFDEEID